MACEGWSCSALLQEFDVEGIDVSAIDSALLMEMLDESCDVGEAWTWAGDDRLGGLVRSLEAEIGLDADDELVIDDGESTTGPSDGGLEDILSHLDSHESLGSAVHKVEDPFDWVEVDVVPNSACHDLPGWYYMEAEVGGGGEGMVYYEEERDCGGFYYGENLTEQAYVPLWQ